MMDAGKYFAKFLLDECEVAKFEYKSGANQVELILYCVDLSSGDGPDSSSASDIDELLPIHRLVFKNVSKFKREGLISKFYEKVKRLMERLGDNPVLIFCVENIKIQDGFKFDATISDFGDITFWYTDLDVEIKNVIEKGFNGTSEDGLFEDVDTGKV